MCALAMLDGQDQTDLERVCLVLLAPTRRIPDQLCARDVGTGNSRLSRAQFRMCALVMRDQQDQTVLVVVPHVLSARTRRGQDRLYAQGVGQGNSLW